MKKTNISVKTPYNNLSYSTQKSFGLSEKTQKKEEEKKMKPEICSWCLRFNDGKQLFIHVPTLSAPIVWKHSWKPATLLIQHQIVQLNSLTKLKCNYMTENHYKRGETKTIVHKKGLAECEKWLETATSISWKICH